MLIAFQAFLSEEHSKTQARWDVQIRIFKYDGYILVDQIDLEIKAGKIIWQAILDPAVSRVRPVSLAAITTILGMVSLLPDVFFRSIALPA